MSPERIRLWQKRFKNSHMLLYGLKILSNHLFIPHSTAQFHIQGKPLYKIFSFCCLKSVGCSWLSQAVHSVPLGCFDKFFITYYNEASLECLVFVLSQAIHNTWAVAAFAGNLHNTLLRCIMLWLEKYFGTVNRNIHL